MKLDVETITVTRRAAGSYVDGRWVQGAATDHAAAGNIQPLSGTELQQLPEGDRNRGPLKIYTGFAFENGDVVTLASGVTFEVQAVSDWTAFGQPHYKAQLMRIEEA